MKVARLGRTNIGLIIAVLILTWPEDLAFENGLDMATYNHQPRGDQENGHDACYPQDAGAVQGISNLDEGNRESHIGEDKAPPREVERHGFEAPEHRSQGNAEEPESERPEEDGRAEGPNAQDICNP
ncbi:hypothetical protein BP5796_11675 [Coleophoma crateriformis]|uniref:Secreted protein n=1 Tax=Coleophoma crateriformis TaxID=565419 RepID=A0A3D8QE18_9HELO|nr:hypothetical protein BP5796_11675 [Coleophoma crateriformis]